MRCGVLEMVHSRWLRLHISGLLNGGGCPCVTRMPRSTILSCSPYSGNEPRLRESRTACPDKKTQIYGRQNKTADSNSTSVSVSYIMEPRPQSSAPSGVTLCAGAALCSMKVWLTSLEVLYSRCGLGVQRTTNQHGEVLRQCLGPKL